MEAEVVEEDTRGQVSNDFGTGGDNAVDPDASVEILELERNHVIAKAAGEPNEGHADDVEQE